MTTTTDLKFNQGRALLHLADSYPDLLSVILEIIQNALDVDVQATKISLILNLHDHYLSVCDNGKGVSLEKFNAALASIAEPGRKGEGSLGQFALGLISPLGKCRKFTFVSCEFPKTKGFHEWEFYTDRIVGTKEDLQIPVLERPFLTLDTPGKNEYRVDWRSRMQLFEIVSDRTVSDVSLEELAGAILDRYGMTMHRNKVEISIEITGTDGKVKKQKITSTGFQGNPLPEVVITNKEGGRTTFRLFVARRGASGRKGKVVLGSEGRDFRFPFHYFSRAAIELLGTEVTNALSDGLLEGEIISEKAELHPSRQSFFKNDAFVGLCLAIEKWHTDVGSSVMDELKLATAEQRFQHLGLRSLKVLERLLKNPSFAGLLGVLKSFKRGNIGIGHLDKPGKMQDDNSLATSGGHTGSSHADGERKHKPKDEHKGHTPMTAIGPSGRPRRLVRNSSFGLQFMHEPMPGCPDLWKLDVENGILAFNVRHPLWTQCDERGDRAIMRLQEVVAIQALTLETLPASYRSSQRKAFDEFNGSFTLWLLDADKLRLSDKSV